jgi:hypothetical protein
MHERSYVAAEAANQRFFAKEDRPVLALSGTLVLLAVLAIAAVFFYFPPPT